MNRTGARYHSSRDVDPLLLDDYERAAKRRREDHSLTASSSQLIDPQFRTLCLSQFSQRIPDEEVSDNIYRAFKKFGEFSVKIAYSCGQRLAYVNFRYSDDAYAAKQACKDRLVLFDDMVRIDVVYNTRPSRGRSVSPPPQPRDAYRRRSPYSSRGKEDLPVYYDRGLPPPMPTPLPPPVKEQRYSSYGSGGVGGAGVGAGGGGSSSGSQGHLLPEDDESATRTLFVGNLDYDITAEELQRVFEKYGVVEDVDVKRAATGSGSYAFIKFFNLDMAFHAKMEMSGRTIGHHQCRIGYGKPSTSSVVWVGGLGDWLRPDILMHVFGRYGAIQSIEWPAGQTYAYVQYTNADDARTAVTTLRGAPLGGPDRRIRVDFAEASQVNSPVNLLGGEHRDGINSSPRDPLKTTERKHLGRTETRHSKHRSLSPVRTSQSQQHASSTAASASNNNDDFSTVTTVVEMGSKLPVVWTGNLMLKNSAFSTKLHLIRGSSQLVDSMMRDPSTTDSTSLKITQRLRLDESKLAEVSRRVEQAASGDYSILLALPQTDSTNASNNDASADIQHRPLKNLVMYLHQKDAAGVIVLPSSPAGSGLLHAFPPCDFARDYLLKRAPQLVSNHLSEEYLLIMVARTGSTS